jgi:tetratricopeptide (TPR) repeat protein
MSRSTNTPPSIADLTARMLNRSKDVDTVLSAADAMGDVQPYEVTVGFRAEPRLAWQESLEVLTAVGLEKCDVPAPADWGALVVRREATAGLPFALANFPQQVRQLTDLLQSKQLKSLLPINIQESEISTGLLKWGTRYLQSGELSHALLAAAHYRAAHDFKRARTALTSLEGRVEGAYNAVLGNEKATLLWEEGNYDGALAEWKQLPDSVPVHFNRGMASLFFNDLTTARAELKKAIAGLEDASPWHHLASLYLALAEMR